MEKKGFFALAGTFLAFVLLPAAVVAQFSEPSNNYVVIGAFAFKENAVAFTQNAKAGHLDARFDLNTNRNLYYVYVLSSSNRQKAVEEALRLRKETPYYDTWVYHGALPVDVDGEVIIPEDAHLTQASLTADPVLFAPQHTATIIAPDTSEITPATEKPLKVKSPVKRSAANVPGTKSFLFSLVRAADGQPLKGEVQIIDRERTREMGSYQGNEPVNVKGPANKTGQVSAVCKLFGYRETLKTFNYNDPGQDGIVVDEEGNYVIPFELVRLQKGDIAVMYNVFFYKDAGVIRPESKFEVEELLQMLLENPQYKVKIHGHTNGNRAGKIISIGEGSSYFSLSNTKEGFGSAKKLSYERANVIRQYLISSGVSADRMQIKAWGGKLSLYDKHHARASENVRVEVEILED
jgi:outer membrane protein OmpA-like peptidoglycan-associated protein